MLDRFLILLLSGLYHSARCSPALSCAALIHDGIKLIEAEQDTEETEIRVRLICQVTQQVHNPGREVRGETVQTGTQVRQRLVDDSALGVVIVVLITQGAH